MQHIELLGETTNITFNSTKRINYFCIRGLWECSNSDKQLTLHSGYLHLVELYTEIMVNKGLSIREECADYFIDVHVLSEQCGQ